MLATSRRVRGKKYAVSRQVSLGPVQDGVALSPAQSTAAGYRGVGGVGALIAVADELRALNALDAAGPGEGDGLSLDGVVLAVVLQRECNPQAKVHLEDFLAECPPRCGRPRTGADIG